MGIKAKVGRWWRRNFAVVEPAIEPLTPEQEHARWLKNTFDTDSWDFALSVVLLNGVGGVEPDKRWSSGVQGGRATDYTDAHNYKNPCLQLMTHPDYPTEVRVCGGLGKHDEHFTQASWYNPQTMKFEYVPVEGWTPLSGNDLTPIYVWVNENDPSQSYEFTSEVELQQAIYDAKQREIKKLPSNQLVNLHKKLFGDIEDESDPRLDGEGS